jgi:DMSO/TMAO reductase YedYZ molybdopterin-dependent catalytic subunit
MAARAREARLWIGGEVENGPLELGHAELAALEPHWQVEDVGRLVPGRTGRAVTLRGVLGLAPPRKGARHLHVESGEGGFAISLPLEEAGEAVIVYELDGAPLPPAKGGPFRLLVPGHPDECVHVKALARLALGRAPGKDTRPADDAAHRELHERAKAKRAPGG